ncbi:hypothetical protein R50073_41370 [Maricurvus nonylphenolicus]|uniref:hypothetical protein n=1 Tax=Maricurvus nonylphenolicus TaxID=1008307 RepID=UPI0036F1AAD0
METSRLVFSLVVGLGFIVLGSVVATKASIGMALMSIGLGLIAISLISSKLQSYQEPQPIVLTTQIQSTIPKNNP